MPETIPSAHGATNDPGALCTYAASCWDRALRGYGLDDTRKSALVQDGLNAVSAALRLAPGHPLALTYQVLLLRLLASLERDPAVRASLEREAETCHRAAVEAQKAALIPRA
jgi:hypothetical protein